MNAQAKKGSRMGRPPLPSSEKKVQKSVYLSPQAISVLAEISDNASVAIEWLAEKNKGSIQNRSEA